MSKYLRFILDSDNDNHYTDSLITLQSAPYIWYRLRRDRCAENIVFVQVRDSDDQLVLHVYDKGSRQHLMQFAKVRITLRGKEQSVQPDSRDDYPLPLLQMSQSDILHKLLDANGKAALIFTHEAFQRICRNADRRSQKQLIDLINEKIPNFPIYIRLPFQAEALEKCMRPAEDESELLRKAYKALIDIPGDKPEPLLQAMTDVMGPRLLRLDDAPDEMFHLLLQMSVTDPGSGDSLEALHDQAEYLELCRTLRIRLLKPTRDKEAGRYTPVSRGDVATELRKPEFREQLRQAVRELRDAHPEGSIRDALSREMLLPAPLPCPAHTDTQALGLSIPDKCASKVSLDLKLDEIKRNLITPCTKPRNPEVFKITQELCQRARLATISQNWLALQDIIDLLVFFSGQICAPEERNEELLNVHDRGKYLLDLCEDLQRRYRLTELTGLDAISAIGINKADQIQVARLRDGINRIIYFFNRPKSQAENIQQMEESWEITMQEISREIESLAAADNRMQQPYTAPQLDDVLSAVDAHTRDEKDLSNIADTPYQEFPVHYSEQPIEIDIPSDTESADAAAPWDFAPGEWTDPEPVREEPAAAFLDPDSYLEERFRKNTTPFQERTPEYDFG